MLKTIFTPHHFKRMGGSLSRFHKIVQDTPTFKVILLGDQGCGKSTILRRYVSNQFVDTGSSTVVGPPPTELTVHLPSLGGGTVGVVFWEISPTPDNLIRAEQCQNSNAAIVVVKSSQENTDRKLSLWKQRAQDLVGEGVPLLVLINCFPNHPGRAGECQLDVPEQDVHTVRPTGEEGWSTNKVINQFLQRLVPKPYPV